MADIIKNDLEKDQDEKEVAIEHSYMDFQSLILFQKMKGLSGVTPRKNYGKIYIAELMVQSDIDFYLQDMV